MFTLTAKKTAEFSAFAELSAKDPGLSARRSIFMVVGYDAGDIALVITSVGLPCMQMQTFDVDGLPITSTRAGKIAALHLTCCQLWYFRRDCL
jgi:hypothetical protein